MSRRGSCHDNAVAETRTDKEKDLRNAGRSPQ